MGVELKLTDSELPVSPIFVDFLRHIVDDAPFEEAQWGDQLSETMLSDQRRIIERAPENAKRVLETEQGQRAIARSYELLLSLMTGDVDAIKDIQLRFHFINIIVNGLRRRPSCCFARRFHHVGRHCHLLLLLSFVSELNKNERLKRRLYI